MKSVQCPYCAEEIKAEAVICKHCHERLYWTREETVMAAIMERLQVALPPYSFEMPSVSACGARCYTHYAHNEMRLKECLDNCKLASVLAEVAARLQRELIVTFADIVWGGGDIDSLPFEKSVRERFSRPNMP